MLELFDDNTVTRTNCADASENCDVNLFLFHVWELYIGDGRNVSYQNCL